MKKKVIDLPTSVSHKAILLVEKHFANNEDGYDFIDECISNHQHGNWGDVDEMSKAQEDYELMNQGTVLSVFRVGPAAYIYVETPWPRKTTYIKTNEEVP